MSTLYLPTFSMATQIFGPLLTQRLSSKEMESVNLDESVLLKIFPTVIYIYPTPPLGQDMTQGQFSSGF